MPSTTRVNSVIEIERAGDVALIRIDNPPVNAAGRDVRQGIEDAINALAGDDSIKAIGLYGAGRTFVAGADIREFGKPPLAPSLPDVCNTIERCGKPVVAVLHGTALGGGLELAMASHARIGLTGLRVGLPEVLLGILPGAGGTQRAPRLVGIPFALDMITTGRHLPAAEALEHGLIDQLKDGDPRDVALASAKAVVAGNLKTRRTDEIAVEPNDAALEAAKAKIAKKTPHLFSPVKCVEAVAASVTPIDEGLATERHLYIQCHDSPQRAGLIHAFFAERAVAKVPEAKATPRPVQKIGVIGGGTMGSGITTSALLAGFDVTMIEVAAEALERGTGTVRKNLEGAVKRGKLAEAKHAETVARLGASTDMTDLADADLVIEAVFENMEVKKEIFTKLDGIVKDGTILASNTSYLNINEIAACTKRPQDVLGLHFFSPAHVMRLLEIVVADKTAPEVVATGFALAKRMKKVGVRAGVCDGFIGNRILSHYLRVTNYMVMDGATPEQIDDALEGFGFAMGPFRVSDLAGLDIGWAERKRLAPLRPAAERVIEIGDRICENGWFGRKTGRGYYVYDEGDAHPNPEVANIIASERAKAGVTPRDFTDQEIVDRYMTAMISEAARVVDDGIALRPVDVDAVFLFGYGFPRFRGGPLAYADTIGAAELIKRIEAYAKEDSHYWQVPDLLRRMAADGSTFAQLNEGK
ncbi:3-hydroxyacyl-CoA dehydrogenase NAD-binding domain-containing protein [Actibacterium lipolyticum]|uniref:Fatty acid oxidation complex subunit alpha n=1 Tax=Actibacterium lipolyticum TaxID=1524263 RepID=A0A238KN34_9RHOB|nr:3-hydroxyacyl-CoA dehydrogenase NAD-binding domain-containing protein [Actibacterium lipolyticum]SMX44223.1 Fatty acid oxidation complex subunit alpha [Actibacterium lipolyticum]